MHEAMQEAATAYCAVPTSILIVEDERIVAMDLAGTLKELGYRVVGLAARSEEAIRCAADLKPDLILMDVRLAGDSLDGIQIAEIIQRSRDIPVIYLTAHSDDDTLRRAAGTSASGYLVKPFKTTELRCAIEIAVHKNAADQIVRQHEHWLSTTLQSIAEAVIATDNSGSVRLFNTVAESMTGWGQQAALQQPLGKILSIVHEETGQPLGDLVRRALDSGKPQRSSDGAALINRSGAKILIRETASVIADKYGEVLGAVLVIRDITESRQQMLEIRKLNESLERRVTQRTAELQAANRELESFSYSVAHDLRAPLRSIDAFSQLLGETKAAQLDAEGLTLLQKVRGGARRMSELIDALLALAGVGQKDLNIVTIDFTQMLREVAAEVATHFGHVVELRIEDELVVHADAGLLRLVVFNLLGNAWKFTCRVAQPRVSVGSGQGNGFTQFHVRDNGAGFDPRYTGKLFEPFQRLHHEHEFSGTGIGLAIVDRAIRRHGGRVWAESQVNNGACFYFTLPMTLH